MLSESAAVTLKLARRRGGRIRTVASRSGARAAGAIPIVLPRRALRRPGRYRVTVVARDAAANASAPARVRFRVPRSAP